MSHLDSPPVPFFWARCSKENNIKNANILISTARQRRVSRFFSSWLLRLRPGDGHVPPGAELHPEPRGRLLLRVRGGARDGPRVSDAARNFEFSLSSAFSHLFSPPTTTRPFSPGWGWSTTVRGTAAETRCTWAASWRRWSKLPSTASTGPDVACRSWDATFSETQRTHSLTHRTSSRS